MGQTFHEAGLAEGTEVVRQNKDLKALSAKKGLVFNDVDAEAFRQRLRGAGFWSKWQQRFGAETWDTLPKKVGKLT